MGTTKCAYTNDDYDFSSSCCWYYLRVKLQQLLKYSIDEMIYEVDIYVDINLYIYVDISAGVTNSKTEVCIEQSSSSSPSSSKS